MKPMRLDRLYKASVIIGIVLCASNVGAQFGEPGLLFSIGVGTGYSSHADSYQLIEPAVRIRDYPGYRIFVIESKIGWKFGEQTAVYLNGNVSPGNTTITPYRSFYAGIGISQSLSFASTFFLKGGVGYSYAAVEKDKSVGTGILVNLGVGFDLGKKFYVDINTFFGKYDEDTYLDPNPFNAGEFQFNIILYYTIL